MYLSGGTQPGSKEFFSVFGVGCVPLGRYTTTSWWSETLLFTSPEVNNRDQRTGMARLALVVSLSGGE